MSVPKDPEKYAAWKKKLSEKAKLRGNNGNTPKGYHHSDEAKKKIGKAASNPSEVTRKRIRKANLGRVHTKQSRQNIGKGRREFLRSLTKEERVKHLEKWISAGRNGSKFSDTAPERKFEKLLIERNIIYEKQKWIGGFLVDFFIPKSNMIVEIQGCYWHSCEQCGYGETAEKARENDRIRKEKLESLGYKIQFIWEHDLMRD